MPATHKKNLFAYLFLALALISLVFAIICFAAETSYATGSYESSKQYGGDAYTGIQNAAAQTANNVYYLTRNVVLLTTCVATTGGLFFLLAAFTFAVIGIKKLGLIDETAAPEAEEVPAPEAEEAPAAQEVPAEEEE